jgi:hypothetical protein
MTYSESAAGITISKDRALLELRRHGLIRAEDFAEFFADMTETDSYSASAVLEWLGY